MRKLIYHIAASIDGFIAHTDGSVDGLLMQGPHADDYTKTIQTYDTIIMGRATYTFGYAFGLEPGQNPYPWANSWVFSKSLNVAQIGGLHVSNKDVVETVRALKQEDGSDIYLCGGGTLAGTLLSAGEIDTLVLKVNPVIFGKGIPLFGGRGTLGAFAPINHKAYDNGVLAITYEKR